MDEPFGALDIMTEKRLQEELHKIWLLAPRTTFFITPDLEEALYLGDRVVLMSPRLGRIASEYRPDFPREKGYVGQDLAGVCRARRAVNEGPPRVSAGPR